MSLTNGLTLQEERQRALVQLQWKVMSDNPPEEQEVNSNKVRLDFIFFLNRYLYTLRYKTFS